MTRFVSDLRAEMVDQCPGAPIRCGLVSVRARACITHFPQRHPRNIGLFAAATAEG
jgi:hypothetical protein